MSQTGAPEPENLDPQMSNINRNSSSLANGEQDQCLWMQAGIVRKKYCNRNYRCSRCVFHKALMRAVQDRKGAIVHWQDKLRQLPHWRRPCVHHMKGTIEYRSCTNDYNCDHCEFDQYIQDQFKVHIMINPVDSFVVDGFSVPQGFYLYEGHSWAKVEENPSVRIGIDDFVAKVLGPFDRIECPLMGKKVEQGKAAIKIMHGEKQAHVLSPVTGIVTSINPQVRNLPELANDAPYGEGWIMTVHSSTIRDNLKHLFINEESRNFISKEAKRYLELIEDVIGPLSTDGGLPVNGILGTIPRLGWERLCRLFLRT
ncbi:MAG: hypothetical protein DRH12_09950 [Deltaproteobacteria bacterium]|nr:MAG: hypothetical protein DRH12_09950 [Deltaproteobacteria bacterium]